ncbi:helix-turn-helix domain-containing protein [Streptomyces sp. NBC_01439]|uniref:helix-turn-helix domain-containing protein n=1 Tax=Streptomyces sp. NBC_01439 TaxID=2903867 RepID=UPI002E2CC83C|nr:helix-turn-helix transcriptional regulator [Streptomyces sp. NBC_01439]
MSQDTAGSEFAELLRELKDRSGLSYGTLAKRLHMSASTLHRYCSGEVVPADYAPVERLARLCKASPEELLALHRSWVRADTNRPRKGADPSGTVQETPGATGATGTGTLPVDTAEAHDAVDAARAADPPEGVEVGSEVEEVTTAAGPTTPTRRPRPRPRPAVLTGIALTVVAAVTALAGVLPLGADRPERGADVRDGPVGATGRSPAGEKSPDGPAGPSSPPPSSPTSSAAPSPSASSPVSSPSSGSSDAMPATPAAGNDSSGGDTAAGTPVKVTTRPHTWEAPCGQHYLIDKPPAQVGPPPVERDAPAWVAAAGAVPAGEQYVTLTLQGSGADTVVLDGLAVRTVAKRAPLPWNDYAMGYPGVGCGADVPTRSFDVALDSARPAVVPVPGQRDFPFSVSESQPEVLHIKAATSAHDVSWYVELSWSSGSRYGTLKIDHNGRPFRTSGRGGRTGYEFPLGGEGWVGAGTTGR